MSDIHYAKRGVTPTCTIASFLSHHNPTVYGIFRGHRETPNCIENIHMVEVF